MRTSQTQVTLTGSVLGTPEYMSPEQARGDADIDHRTDLYSAGVVLYEMLTGQTPFHCETATATIRRILDEEPPDPRKLDKSIDPALASLALRLMAKRPEDRLASAAEVLTTLETGSRARMVVRPRRWKREALVGLGLVFMAVAAWLTSALWPHPADARRLTGVKLDDDGKGILVRYGDSAEWRVWRLPSVIAGGAEISAVRLMQVDPRGDPIVVVGLASRSQENEEVLFAFAPDGTKRWGVPLTPDPPEFWPDADHAEPWVCRTLDAGDLGLGFGEEIVVVGQEGAGEFPSRLSLVNPANGHIRSTYWHMGHILGVLVIQNVFDERPGIVAWALNNKLDGFDDRKGTEDHQAGDDTPRTKWDVVTVVMILDPADMDGLGPPRTARLDWLPGANAAARPYAYAFMDAPAGPAWGLRQKGTKGRTQPNLCDLAILWSKQGVYAQTAGSQLQIQVPFLRAETEESAARCANATLRLDRHLDIVKPDGVMWGNGHPEETRDKWRTEWRVIIREGKYVDEEGQTGDCGPDH